MNEKQFKESVIYQFVQGVATFAKCFLVAIVLFFFYSEIAHAETLIATGTLTGAATASITNIPSGYDGLLLQVIGLKQATASRVFEVEVSNDNGSTFKTTGYNTDLQFNGVHTNRGDAFVYSGTMSSGDVANMTLYISNYLTSYVSGQWTIDNTTAVQSGAGYGFYTGATTTINALKLLWNGSGNFTAGTYAIYGIGTTTFAVASSGGSGLSTSSPNCILLGTDPNGNVLCMASTTAVLGTGNIIFGLAILIFLAAFAFWGMLLRWFFGGSSLASNNL